MAKNANNKVSIWQSLHNAWKVQDIRKKLIYTFLMLVVFRLVGVIPGIHFGTEGFMRLSYCYSDADLKEGLDRIEKFIKSL